VVRPVRFEINRLFQGKPDDAFILGRKIISIDVCGRRIAIVGGTKVCWGALSRYATVRGRKQVAEGRSLIIMRCIGVTRSGPEFVIHYA
jgi:hypothetical protein